MKRLRKPKYNGAYGVMVAAIVTMVAITAASLAVSLTLASPDFVLYKLHDVIRWLG